MKRIVLCLGALLLGLGTWTIFGAGDEPKRPDAVRELMQDQKYDDAAAALDKLLEANEPKPDKPDFLRYLKGRAQHLAGKHREALQTFASIERDFADSLWVRRARFGQAAALLKQGDFEEAEHIYEAEVKYLLSTERKHEIASIYLEFADAYFQPPKKPGDGGAATEKKPDYAKALNFYKKALEVGPNDERKLEVEFRVARCHQELGQHAEAAAAYQAFLKAHPKSKFDIETRFQLGTAQLAQGQNAEARKTWKDLVDANPNGKPAANPAPLAPLAGRGVGGEGSEVPPNRLAEAAYQIAHTYGLPAAPSKEDLELGVAAAEKFIASYPDHKLAPKAALEIAQGFVAHNQLDEAIAALKKLIGNAKYAKAEELAEARSLVGFAFQRQKKFAEAIAAWQEYLAKHPAHVAWAQVQQAIIDTEFLTALESRRDGSRPGTDAETKAKKFADARKLWEAFLARYPLDARAASIMLEFGLMNFERGDVGVPALAGKAEGEKPEGERPAEAGTPRKHFDAAIADWSALVSKYPNTEESSRGQYLIGLAFEEKLGKFDDALAAYRKLTWGQFAARAKERIDRLTRQELVVQTERVFRTNQQPRVKVTTRNIKQLAVKAYRVDMETYFRKMHLARGIESLDIALIDPEKSWTFEVPNYADHKQITSQIEIPLDSPGVMAVTVANDPKPTETAPAGITVRPQEATTMIAMSDLDILVKCSRNELFVFAENMRTGKPFAGVKLLVSDGSKVFAEGTTNDDGVFVGAVSDADKTWESLKGSNDVRVFAVAEQAAVVSQAVGANEDNVLIRKAIELVSSELERVEADKGAGDITAVLLRTMHEVLKEQASNPKPAIGDKFELSAELKSKLAKAFVRADGQSQEKQIKSMKEIILKVLRTQLMRAAVQPSAPETSPVIHTASNVVGLKGIDFAQGIAAKGYVYTDRPTYRPGQLVHVRGIVRWVKGDEYFFEEGKKFKLDVFDSRGRQIRTEDVSLGEFGTFATRFVLPAEADQGDYRLHLHDPAEPERHNYAGSFAVHEYQLQPVEIAIDTPKKVYVRGQTVEGTIKLRYYYGSPVAAREIRYVLPDGTTHTATTSAAGEVAFKFETREFREDQPLPIVVQYPELNLQSGTTLFLATRAFRAAVATPRDVFIAGETFDVTVTTTDAAGKKIGQKMSLAVVQKTELESAIGSRQSAVGQTGERMIEEHPLVTDKDSGVAHKTIKIAAAGTYFLRTSGTDEFGNPVSAERTVTISGNDDTVRLRILADRHNYKAGDTATVQVHWREEPALALVTYQGARVLGYRLVELKKGTNELEIPITEKLAPNFDLTISVMTDSGGEPRRHVSATTDRQPQVSGPATELDRSTHATVSQVAYGHRETTNHLHATADSKLAIAHSDRAIAPSDQETAPSDQETAASTAAMAASGLAKAASERETAALDRVSASSVVAMTTSAAEMAPSDRATTASECADAAKERAETAQDPEQDPPAKPVEASKGAEEITPLPSFHEASSPFEVERPLVVTIKPSADRVRPGDEVEVAVTTTDPQGNPVRAELSLAMIEKSLLQLFPDQLPAVAQFFEGTRRTSALRTVASCTFRYAPATRDISQTLIAEANRVAVVEMERASRAALAAGEVDASLRVFERRAGVDRAAEGADEDANSAFSFLVPLDRGGREEAKLGEPLRSFGGISAPARPSAPAVRSQLGRGAVSGRAVPKNGESRAKSEALKRSAGDRTQPDKQAGGAWAAAEFEGLVTSQSTDDFDTPILNKLAYEARGLDEARKNATGGTHYRYFSGKEIATLKSYAGSVLSESDRKAGAKRAQLGFMFGDGSVNYVDAGFVVNGRFDDQAAKGGVAVLPEAMLRETGYWNPRVVTDDDGRATVSITVPDRSTAWQLAARGTTTGTLTGQAAAELTAKKELFGELKLPLAFVDGDSAQIQATIQNDAVAKGKLEVTLKTTIGGKSREEKRTIDVEAKGTHELTFDRDIAGTGDAVFELTVRSPALLKPDDGDAALTDATRAVVPVRPYGIPVYSTTGGAASSNMTAWISPPAGMPVRDASLQIVVGASVERSLLDVVLGGGAGGSRGGVYFDRMLACESPLERTTSDLMASIGLMKLLGETRDKGSPEAAALADRVRSSIGYLVSSQNDDGGWHWSAARGTKQGSSDRNSSARGLWSLALARKAGFAVPDDAFNKSITFVQTAFTAARENDYDGKSMLLHSLSAAGRGDFAYANRLHRSRPSLSPTALAYLALAFVEMDRKEIAKELLDLLGPKLASEDVLLRQRSGRIDLQPVLAGVISHVEKLEEPSRAENAVGHRPRHEADGRAPSENIRPTTQFENNFASAIMGRRAERRSDQRVGDLPEVDSQKRGGVFGEQSEIGTHVDQHVGVDSPAGCRLDDDGDQRSFGGLPNERRKAHRLQASDDHSIARQNVMQVQFVPGILDRLRLLNHLAQVLVRGDHFVGHGVPSNPLAFVLVVNLRRNFQAHDSSPVREESSSISISSSRANVNSAVESDSRPAGLQLATAARTALLTTATLPAAGTQEKSVTVRPPSAGSAEVRALYLMALNAVAPGDAKAKEVADRLLAQRAGARWAPERATGPAVVALGDYFATARFAAEHYKLKVFVNDEQVAEMDMDGAAGSRVVDVPKELLARGEKLPEKEFPQGPGGDGAKKQRINFELVGRGRFTFNCVMAGFVAADQLKSTVNNYHLERYFDPAPIELDGREIPRGFDVLTGPFTTWRSPVTELPVGRRAQVLLYYYPVNGHLIPEDEREYVVITEPIPSGCTVLEKSITGQFDRYEIGPGYITFYVGNRSQPNEIRFDIYGYLPGKYRAAPTVVRNFYDPERMVVSQPRPLTVLTAGQKSKDEYRITPRELYELGKRHAARAGITTPLAVASGGMAMPAPSSAPPAPAAPCGDPADAANPAATGESAGPQDLALAAGYLTELFDKFQLKPEIYKEVAQYLFEIALVEGKSPAIVRYFEILKEKYPGLEIPFGHIVKVGAAYRELNEYERSYLVFRATAEASFARESEIGGFLESQGEFERSVAVMDRILREYPAEPYIASATYALAQRVYAMAPHAAADAKLREKRLSKVDLIRGAIGRIDDFLTMWPDDPAADQASFSLASALVELENWPAAVARSNRFAERFPKSQYLDSFWYIMGYSHFAQGKHRDALDMCRRVAEATRTDPATGRVIESSNKWRAIYISGQIHHSLGEPAEAITEYGRVADRFPDAKETIAYFTRKAIELPEVTAVKPPAAKNPASGGREPPDDARPGSANPDGETRGLTPPARQAEATAQVELKYRNVASCEVKVYRIDLLKFGLLQRDLANITKINLAGIRPLHEAKVELGDGKDYADRTKKLELPLTDEGAYLVVCRGEDLHTSGLVLVTPLVVEVQEEQPSGRVRATVKNTVTDKYTSDVHVKVIGTRNNKFKDGATDLRGVFVADGILGRSTVIARAGDGQYAFHRGTLDLGPPPAPPATPKPQSAAPQGRAGQAPGQSMESAPEGAQQELLQELFKSNRMIQEQKGKELKDLYEKKSKGVQAQDAF